MSRELDKGFQIGDWEVYPARGVLRRGDREEMPEPKVFQLLIALAARDGDVATKEDLVEEVWDGYPVGDDSITRCVAQLRKHLGEQGKAYVKTLTRRGYRLDVPVELIGQDVPETPDARAAATSLVNQGRLWMVIAAVVVTLIIAFTPTDIFWPDGRVESIAVLPFENLSGDDADQYRVSGIKVELVQSLHHLPDISVKHGRVTYPGLEVSEIAELLDVDAVLFGELQRYGSMLKITYRIAHGSNGEVVAAGEVEGDVGEEFALQEEMAFHIRSEILGEPAQQLISSSRHPNSDAYDRYMRGLFLLEHRGRGRAGNLETAIDLFEQAIEMDPEFGLAYLSLASAYVLLPDYLNAPLQESHEQALEILDRGIAADDAISDAASAVIGYVYHKQRQWALAEQAYQRATTAAVVDSNAFNWYSLMLAGVGRLEDALEQIRTAQRIDPSSVIINTRMGMIYTWLGDSANATEFLDRASQLDASMEMHMLGRTLLLSREGRLQEAATMFDAGVSQVGGNTEWLAVFFEALEDPDKIDAALAEIDRAFADPVMDPRINVIIRTVLGDVDGAMDIAMTLAEPGVFHEMDFLFTPELRSLRGHEDFLTLMDRLAVVEYWEANGCVWNNDRVSC
jgi:DNA-binding winged helix-turn-helix (wHTH) protein/TolB-like protein/Tfp pilus assembly protein PilF